MYIIAWEDYDNLDKFFVPRESFGSLAESLAEDGHTSTADALAALESMAAGDTIHIGPVNVAAFTGDFPGWQNLDPDFSGWNAED